VIHAFLLSLLFALASTRKPDFSGVWRLDTAQSTFRQAPPDDLLVKIQHHDPVLIQTMLLVSANGEQRQTFTYDTRGVDVAFSTGAGEGYTRAWWNGTELIIESVLHAQARTLSFADHWSLSADGRTLQMAHVDDELAGQRVLFERASSDAEAKFRHDP
jgi:hypothetical protein